MKIETILDAMVQVYAKSEHDPFWGCADYERRMRQWRAFRARILRVTRQGWCFQCGRREWDGMIIHTYDCKYSEMERQLAAKDTRIAELEGYLRALHHDEL